MFPEIPLIQLICDFLAIIGGAYLLNIFIKYIKKSRNDKFEKEELDKKIKKYFK